MHERGTSSQEGRRRFESHPPLHSIHTVQTIPRNNFKTTRGGEPEWYARVPRQFRLKCTQAKHLRRPHGLDLRTMPAMRAGIPVFRNDSKCRGGVRKAQSGFCGPTLVPGEGNTEAGTREQACLNTSVANLEDSWEAFLPTFVGTGKILAGVGFDRRHARHVGGQAGRMN